MVVADISSNFGNDICTIRNPKRCKMNEEQAKIIADGIKEGCSYIAQAIAFSIFIGSIIIGGCIGL